MSVHVCVAAVEIYNDMSRIFPIYNDMSRIFPIYNDISRIFPIYNDVSRIFPITSPLICPPAHNTPCIILLWMISDEQPHK